MTAKLPSTFDGRVYLSALCRVIPEHIVERVLRNPTEASLGQQHAEGTVLVVDMVGFTPLCERLTREGRPGLSRLSALLDRLFDTLEAEAIGPYRGYVVQFAGDALIVVYRGEDHARRAMATALAIRRQVAGLAGSEETEGLMVRVGLAAGGIYLNVLGDLVQRLTVCTGPAVHRAIQLQQRAAPGEIAADVAVLGALGDNLVTAGEQIRDLRCWPAAEERTFHEGQLADNVEQKIRLLEPFLPPPLARRVRGMPHSWRLQGEIRRPLIQLIDFEGYSPGSRWLKLAVNLSRSLVRGVRKYDGVVLKLVATESGHRALVLYGLSRPAENDVERALLAALEVQSRLQAFLAGHPGTKLRCRSATHVGEVYLGSIGSWQRHDITAVGDAVNAAARLVELAEPFEVLATEKVCWRLEGAIHHSERGQLSVKGRVEPLKTYLVHGLADGEARYVQRRRTVRFQTGHSEERGRLEEIVAAALTGRGRVIGIVGAAGTGKSHLLSQIIDRWVGHGGIGMVGRCRYATRTTPLAPLVSMFSTFIGLAGADTEEERAERVRTRMSPYPIEQGMAEFMALFQPVRRPDGLPESLLDLADMHAQQRVLDAITQFVEQRICEVSPLYVLEDLQHADALTLQLVRRISALSREGNYLFIGTYRPEPHLQDVRAAFDEELVLEHLDRPQCTALVCHEMGSHAVDPELDDFLWRRTEGNPALLTEIVRFLGERMLLNVVGGMVMAAEPGLPLLEDVVPDSWQHVALARLEGLGELERRLVRIASAIGHEFDGEVLRQACDLDNDELVASAVHSLEARELIAVEWGDQPSLRFRDEATRAAAYALIPDDERRGLHRRIADALERHVPSDRIEAIETVLAHHRERAAQWRLAAERYARAAERASRAGFDRETLFCVERWRNAVQQLGPAEVAPDRAARLELLQLLATVRQGKPTEILACVGQLERHREALSPTQRRVLELYVASALAAQAELWRARECLEAIVHDSSARPGIRADAGYFLAAICFLTMDRASGSGWIRRGLELAPDDPIRSIMLQLLEGRMMLYDGETDGARLVFEQARARAQEQGRLQLLAAAVREQGHHALLVEHWEACRQHLHHALTLDRRLAGWLWQAEDTRLLGKMHLCCRDFPEARRHLEQAVMISQEIGHEVIRVAALVDLGAVLAQTEDPDAGRTMCEQALRAARRYGLKLVEIEGSLNLLQMALDRQDRAWTAPLVERCRELAPLVRTPLHRATLERLLERAAARGG